jgi:hypothetical protein
MLAYIDVFVDDFIACAQGDQARLNRVRRILFHAVDNVFRPLDAADGPHRKEPISISKLLKGDASWETCKKILGWIIDTVAMTLTLPESRLQRLADILAEIPRSQKRLSIQRWHRLLGELRSMSLALPGARGLFSHLQAALATKKTGRLRLARGFHDALDDFCWLHHDLQSRPTRLYELVPVMPTVVGTHDASGTGAGGVWLPRSHTTLRAVPLQVVDSSHNLVTVTLTQPVPIIWRTKFPTSISNDLVSFRNPHGSITNSDLELAGGIINDDAAAHCFDVRERTTKASTDNLATMYWHRKGSVTSTSATAYLLRICALHQRYHGYHPLKDYIPGPRNNMADDASRLFHLTNPAFLSYFNSTYPQPQSWHLWTPTPQILSAMTSALRKQTSKPASFLLAPAPPIISGISGSPSATKSEWILPYKLSKIPFHSSKSSLIASDTALSPPAKDRNRSRTVEGTLRSVGQTFASVGAADPRLTLQGKMDFRLQRQLACYYSKQDPPPDRVKPVPIAIIRQVLAAAITAATIDNLAVADMIVLAFFFLLRPGEYTALPSDTTPFRMCDVQLFIGPVRIDPGTADEQSLWTATFASLTFTTQKNGVRGEVIGLGRSGDPHFCPVLCLVRPILHLRHFTAPASTPLATYFLNHKWHPVSAGNISTTLRLAAAVLGPTFGFLPKDISARSMRAAGATALLCAQVDTDIIRLIGRWRSDEMLGYLHVQAEPVMRHFAQRMLTHGAFTMHPGQDVPMN